MEACDIVVVGSCMIDFVCYAPRLPLAGETIHGNKFDTNFGGKGANQCVAAAKLGGKTALVARVGDDIWGQKYIDHLKQEKVNAKNVLITPGVANGIAQITVADSGENQIVIVAGANSHLKEFDVSTKNVKDLIANAKVVICQLETSPDVALTALSLCSNITILNGAPAIIDHNPKLLSAATIFCVNETEASVFSGIQVNSILDAEKAVEALIKKGCNTVILTLGKDGAVFASKGDPATVHVKCPKVNTVDTTGAGDAFIGALAFVLATNPKADLKKAVEVACFAASDSTTKPGTQNSFPGASVLKKIL